MNKILKLIVTIFLLTACSKNLIEVNLPSRLADGITQEELDIEVKNKVYKSATLNNDGSITYNLTKKQQKNILNNLKQLYDDSILEMVDEDENIVSKINRNNNFCEFEIIVTENKLPLNEELINANLIYMCRMYNIYSNEIIENITIKSINKNTKEIIDIKTFKY